MNLKQRTASLIVDRLEFFLVSTAGKWLGISWIVRYLRNPNPRLTVKLLRKFGAIVGDGTTIKRSIIIDNAYEDMTSRGDFSGLIIGNNCYIGDDVYMDLADSIFIEDNVVISARVAFITHADCNRSEYLSEKYPRQQGGIRIESGSWIGFNAVILHGVTVGENSLVAACSLVDNNVDGHALYSGVPAKKAKEI